MDELDQTHLSHLVSAVLESARTELVRRMNERGHPLTLTRHTISIPNDPEFAGWNTQAITEQVSGLYPDEVQWDVSDRSVPHRLLGFKDQLLPLAEYLSRNTNLAEGRFAGLLGDDEIDGLLFRCLSSMAVDYLTSLTDLGSGDEEYAIRLAAELYEMATSNSITHLNHIAASGVYPDEQYSYRGVSIRPLTGRERGNWAEHFHPRDTSPAPRSDFIPFGPFPSMAMPSALIQIATTRPLHACQCSRIQP